MVNRLMCVLCVSVLVSLAAAGVIESSAEQTTMTPEDSSDLYEYFEPQNEEEAYRGFQSAFPLKYISPEEVEMVDEGREREFDSTSKEIEFSDDSGEVAATATPHVPTEVPETTVRLASWNETDAEASHGQADNLNGTNSQSLLSVPSETDDEPVYHSMTANENNAIRQATAVTHPSNEAYSSAEEDYVNDGFADADAVERVTQPAAGEDTTVVPLASPSSLLFSSVPAQQTTAATTSQPPAAQNATASKKSAKKIETSSRIYKYSADEILRKYLEDTYIRAPLAALINTSPEALRKAKILWKSTLRPNTPIDIVLLAFNSSGKPSLSQLEINHSSGRGVCVRRTHVAFEEISAPNGRDGSPDGEGLPLSSERGHAESGRAKRPNAQIEREWHAR